MKKQLFVKFDLPPAPAYKFPDIEPLLLACRYREAIEAGRKLVAAEPGNSAAWRVLHEAYAGARDFPPALEAIERALALKPDNRLYQRLHAICLKENRWFPAAISIPR